MSNLVRTTSALFLLGVCYWLLFFVMFGDAHSADLRSVWLAGVYFPEGDPGLIYRQSDELFTMKPPDEWIARTLIEEREVAIYPFIYPPLWAWATSQVAGILDYDAFIACASTVNRILVPLMFFLAWRIAAPSMSLVKFMMIAFILAIATHSFLHPLRQNQPQILVSFLILLALERQRSGWEISGGAALALAASIKLYPAVFALIWLAAGNRRAFMSFVAFGGALGLASLSVASWEMHLAMLNEYAAISKSVLVSRANYSVAPLLTALTLPETDLLLVTDSVTGGGGDWGVILKPEFIRQTEVILQACTLFGLLIMAHKTKMREPLLWAGAAVAISWASPLSWIYHYMTALVFLPVLIDRLRWQGVALLAICVLPQSWVFSLMPFTDGINKLGFLLLANSSIMAMGLSYFALALPSTHPLRTEAQSL